MFGGDSSSESASGARSPWLQSGSERVPAAARCPAGGTCWTLTEAGTARPTLATHGVTHQGTRSEHRGLQTRTLAWRADHDLPQALSPALATHHLRGKKGIASCPLENNKRKHEITHLRSVKPESPLHSSSVSDSDADGNRSWRLSAFHGPGIVLSVCSATLAKTHDNLRRLSVISPFYA